MANSNSLHPDTADRFNRENYNQPFYDTSNVRVIRGDSTKIKKFAANSNFAPPLRDNASNYNEVYANPDSRFEVQNARVSRNREQTLQSRPSEDGRRNRRTPRRYRGPNEMTERDRDIAQQTQLLNNQYYEDIENLDLNSQVALRSRYLDTSKITRPVLARGRGNVFGFTCFSVTAFIAVPQAIFLMLGFVMMGIASQTEESWTFWLAEKTFGFTSWLSGFEYTGLMAMASGSFLLAGIIGLSSLFGFVLWALFLGLSPFNGNSADTKHSHFMLAVALSMVPFGSLKWIQSVMRHPK
jgi:hypothetical protein